MAALPVHAPPIASDAPSLRGHAVVDQRSLHMHRLVAQKLLANPVLLDRARANVARWKSTASQCVQHALTEWETILSRPLPEIVSFLESTSQKASRLRQSSPFTGILSTAERTAVIKEYSSRSHTSAHNP